MQIVSLTKTEQVRQAILVEILSGRLRAGERLLEAKLSKEFGVSQATVNAALLDLHNQGLVTKLLNRSTNVSRYTAEELEKIYAVRAVLEPAAAATVATQWSPAAEGELATLVEEMRRAARSQQPSKFCLADYGFHQTLYKLTNNSFLIQACQAIAAAPFAYFLCDHPEPDATSWAELAEEHQRVLDSLAKGPAAAEAAVRQIIDGWHQNSRRNLSSVAV